MVRVIPLLRNSYLISLVIVQPHEVESYINFKVSRYLNPFRSYSKMPSENKLFDNPATNCKFIGVSERKIREIVNTGVSSPKS